MLEVCDIGDDSYGYAYLSTLLSERTSGPYTVAVAADSDLRLVPQLLMAAGWALAVVDGDAATDLGERFAYELADETGTSPAQRRALGLARGLQAGALSASLWPVPEALGHLRALLAAHSALAAGRYAAAVAFREVLRELYPAALRAYPDPADPVALAVLDAAPEPAMLAATAGRGNRGREAAAADAVGARLVAAGVAEQATIHEAITALRVAIAETPRRGGPGHEFGVVVAATVQQAIAAVRACDAAGTGLVNALAERLGSASPAGHPAPAEAAPAPAAPAPRAPVPQAPAPTTQMPAAPTPVAPMAPARSAAPVASAHPPSGPPPGVPPPAGPPPAGPPPVSPGPGRAPAHVAAPQQVPVPTPRPAGDGPRAHPVPVGSARAPVSPPVSPSPPHPVPTHPGPAPDAPSGRPISPPPPPPPGITPISERRRPAGDHPRPPAPDDRGQPAAAGPPPHGARERWPTAPPRAAPRATGNGRTAEPAGQRSPLVEPTLPPELRGDPAPTLPRRPVSGGNGVPRSVPPVSADDDDTLLIFAQTRSAWFVEDNQQTTWESPMDAGWQAAEQAAQPAVGDATSTGLPRRVPSANLVPGAPPRADDRPLRVVRDPAAIAAHTSGYFNGWRRGQEVGGYPLGNRPARQAAGAWEFYRDQDRPA